MAATTFHHPTAPLPPAVVRAVTVYETAAARYDELIASQAGTLSRAEFADFQNAQQAMADAFGVLAEAGRTDLLAPLSTADQYRTAAWRCRRAAAQSDFDGCLVAQDEMRMCRCQLESAGRLDLIGVA